MQKSRDLLIDAFDFMIMALWFHFNALIKYLLYEKLSLSVLRNFHFGDRTPLTSSELICTHFCNEH
jgi:hypothetical protein